MIKGKLVLKGIIELKSPLLIGSGNKESTDIDVLLDAEGKPFIPATSFIGAIKDFLNIEKDDEFWGFTKDKDQRQSNVICSDLYSSEGNKPVVSIRDGIKINGKTGIIEEKDAKFNYQIVEKDAKFKLYLEASYKSNEDKVSCKNKFISIKSALEDEKFRIGAKTNSGFGKIKLDVKFYELDFSNKDHVLKWLKKELPEEVPLPTNPISDKTTFIINATLKLKNSFIIGSYSDMADSESIKSGDDFVITGASLKGAIRKRAERILNTLGKSENKLKDIFKNLFGDVDEINKIAIKSRIRIDEVILPKYSPEQQTRIKIDRFTGGTIESALFNSMPLFSNPDKDEHIKDVKIEIKNYEDFEVGLILLVLKDLWTGDLAVGGEKNVGRGVFEGIKADIRWNNGSAELTKDDLSALLKMQTFVDALNKEVGNDGKK